MSQDDEQRRSRVVVETPTSRREVEQVRTVRAPERQGFSTGMVAAVALAAIAVTALIFLFVMNPGTDEDNTNVRVNASAPTPLATQPTPIIIQQQAPPPTQQAPIIITQPPVTSPDVTINTPPASTAPPASSGTDDATVQTNLSRKILDDTQLASTDITATVTGGRAMLTGTVATADLKRQAERVALSVRGVKSVDNRIEVTGGTD